MPLVWQIHFKASFGNLPILDALLASNSQSKGKSAGLRQWELETINALGWTEQAWIRLGLEERYRKVCSHKLKDWMASLESEEQLRKMKAKSGK